MIFQDKKKKSVKALHKTDTTLVMLAYEYKLKPGDILAISIGSIIKTESDLTQAFQVGNASAGNMISNGMNMQGQANNQSLNTGFMVENSGEINVPIVGKIKIQGLTIQEAKAEIQKQVDKYIGNTLVNVRMLNFYISLLGEVTIQGRITAENDKLTLLDAIALAGGFKEFANRNYLKIIRRDELKTHIFYLDITDQDILVSKDIYLHPNDVIIVDPMRAKNLRTYSISNITLGISAISLVIALSFSFRSIFGLR